MKYYAICLVALLFALTCRAQPATGSVDLSRPDFEKKLDALIKDYQDLGIFSGVVLVADEGTPVYHKAFGLADRDRKIANTTTTLFDIGSMNKTFTQIVVKQLMAEGKLRLSDKLTDFVTGFADERAAQITVGHLLEHESGFDDYHSPDYFDAPKSQRTLAAIVDRARQMELMFDPGTDQAYSNTGYVLLGAIIEKVSGESYFDNVATRIVKPLGLKNTYLREFDDLQDRMATGYYYAPLGQLESSAPIQDEPNPDGGFLSTTEDVMRFYRSYYYGDLLMSEEAKADDPFFQFIRSIPPGKAMGAAGGFDGFNTSLYQVIRDDVTIIVFANMDEPVAEHIAGDILDLSRGETPAKPVLPAIQNVRQHFEKHGPDYVKTHFDELTTNYHPEDPKEWILNDLGYAFMYGRQDAVKAVELFEVNAALFPESANVWDSLGEGLLKKGDRPAALNAYQKALSIRPDLPSAKEAVAKLKK